MNAPHNNGIQPLGELPSGSDRTSAIPRVQAVVRPVAGLSHPVPGAGVPNAVELIKALRRRWVLALVLGTLCAGVAAAVLWRIVPPAEYRAQARLRVASNPPRIIFQTAEDRVDFPTFQRTQLALIKSQLVLNTALNSLPEDLEILNDHADQIRWLEEQIQVSFDGEILLIAMTSTNPKGLAQIVNAVKDAYLKEVVDVHKADRDRRHKDLENIYIRYQERLAEKRAALENVARELGSTDKEVVNTTHELALERRAFSERELMEVQSQLRKAIIELKYYEQSGPVRSSASLGSGLGVAPSVIDELIRDDKTVQELEGVIERLEQELTATAHKYRRPSTMDPALRNIQAELSKSREALNQRVAQLQAHYRAHPPSVAAGVGDPAAVLRQKIAILREQEALIQQDVEKLTQRTDDINIGSIDLESIKAEIDKMEKAADRVGAEVEALKVELNAPSRVQPLEAAGDPRVADDKRLKMAGMGGLGTFAMVLLGVSWLELQSRRIDSVHDVARGLGLPIMGALPPNGQPKRRSVASKGAPAPKPLEDRVLVESIDAVRTLLLHSMRLDAVQSVMVTSAVAGEGKSSLACHLAISLARTGRRTLLIDGDLRKPTLHRLFDQSPEPGLSELLRGQAELEDVVRLSGVEGLWIIPAGQWDRRAIEALTLDVTRAIFDRLKAAYDFVVIDSSPILPVTDALLMGQHVDAAICSIRRDFSRVPLVQSAKERMERLGIRVLGAVVAGVRSEILGGEYKYDAIDA